MALGEIPPWLNVQPSQFVQAASEGAAAGQRTAQLGLEGQRLAQDAAQHSASLADQANAQAAQIQMEQAKLAQAAQQEQVELQAKKDQAAQAAAMAMQQHEVEHAYKMANINLGQQRLQSVAQAAAEKQKQAALSLQDTIGFAKYMKENPEDTMGALALFPNAGQRAVSSARITNPERDKIHFYQGGAWRLKPGASQLETLQEPLTPNTDERVLEWQIRDAIKNSPDSVPALTQKLKEVQASKRAPVVSTGTGNRGSTLPDWMNQPAGSAPKMPSADELPPSSGTETATTPAPAPTEAAMPEFKTEEEALASGVKGIVIINGRKARID